MRTLAREVMGSEPFRSRAKCQELLSLMRENDEELTQRKLPVVLNCVDDNGRKFATSRWFDNHDGFWSASGPCGRGMNF